MILFRGARRDRYALLGLLCALLIWQPYASAQPSDKVPPDEPNPSQPKGATKPPTVNDADHAPADDKTEAANEYIDNKQIIVTATRTATPVDRVGSATTIVDSAEIKRRRMPLVSNNVTSFRDERV